jgi:hypothetical protein
MGFGVLARVVPLDVISTGADTARAAASSGGGAEPWVQQIGLANPELADHGTPQS